MSSYVGRRPAAWLQSWLHPQRNDDDPRPSAFQAGHIPSWRGSCECYALSPVAVACRWLLLLLSPLLSARPDRSGLGVEPGGDARRPGQPDGTGAAGAAATDERGAPVRAQGDHLGVTPVPGSSPVPAPVCGVRLDLVARASGRRRRRRWRRLRGDTRHAPAGRPRDAGPGPPPGPARWPRMSCQVRLPVTRSRNGWSMRAHLRCRGSRVRVCPCSDPSPEPDSCQTSRQAGSVQGRRSRSRSDAAGALDRFRLAWILLRRVRGRPPTLPPAVSLPSRR